MRPPDEWRSLPTLRNSQSLPKAICAGSRRTNLRTAPRPCGVCIPKEQMQHLITHHRPIIILFLYVQLYPRIKNYNLT